MLKVKLFEAIDCVIGPLSECEGFHQIFDTRHVVIAPTNPSVAYRYSTMSQTMVGLQDLEDLHYLLNRHLRTCALYLLHLQGVTRPDDETIRLTVLQLTEPTDNPHIPYYKSFFTNMACVYSGTITLWNVMQTLQDQRERLLRVRSRLAPMPDDSTLAHECAGILATLAKVSRDFIRLLETVSKPTTDPHAHP